MYIQLRRSLQGTGAGQSPASASLPRASVDSNVIALGMTSLFTDISSEMVNSVLPLYFLIALGFNALSFGLVDGLNQGAAALLALFGGVAADRWQRYKLVAALGYGLSMLARAVMLLAGGVWSAVVGAILVDRIGKGIRTAPRDALIALSSQPEALGFAFGVHRSLDTLGALLGPIIAFGLLSAAPNSFDAVFAVSCCAAVLGFGVLVLFVNGKPKSSHLASGDSRPSNTAVPLRISIRAMDGILVRSHFGMLVAVSAALSLTTISDGFIYLVLQHGLHFGLGLFPLLYVGTALAYFILAIPAGWLADRIGRAHVLVVGYVLLLLVCIALLHPSTSLPMVCGYLVLFGAYYASTDGVLSAYASPMLPDGLRASGLAALNSATGLASLLSSIIFGALWTWRGPHAAVEAFCVCLACAIGLASVYFFSARREPDLRGRGPFRAGA